MYRSSSVLEFFIILISWNNPIIVIFGPSEAINLGICSVPNQGTKELYSSLYNPPCRGEYILSPDPSNFYDHLITTMVDDPPSGAWLVIIAPYGSEYYIRIDYSFSSS